MRYAISIAAFLLATASQAGTVAQDSTGLPGDHFSLEGALDLFKRSASLEDFEKALNKADSKVNNLDLNEDGNTDYIRVVDHANGTAHAIVLQVPVTGKESQDVAVIELEKQGEGNAVVQIRGDEDLYGADKLIQPKVKEEARPAERKGGPLAPDAPAFIFVNVWGWPCVQWMYGPSYTMWNSPYYWGYYPVWWHPWHPYHWHTWWGWQTGYYNSYYYQWYQPGYTACAPGAHALYVPRRAHSPTVVSRIRERNPVERTRVQARPADRLRPTDRTDPALHTVPRKPAQLERDKPAPLQPGTTPDRVKPQPEREQPRTMPDRVQPPPQREQPRTKPDRLQPPPQRERPEPQRVQPPRHRQPSDPQRAPQRVPPPKHRLR